MLSLKGLLNIYSRNNKSGIAPYITHARVSRVCGRAADTSGKPALNRNRICLRCCSKRIVKQYGQGGVGIMSIFHFPHPI